MIEKNREEIIWNQEFGEMMSRYLIIQDKMNIDV